MSPASTRNLPPAISMEKQAIFLSPCKARMPGTQLHLRSHKIRGTLAHLCHLTLKNREQG